MILWSFIQLHIAKDSYDYSPKNFLTIYEAWQLISSQTWGNEDYCIKWLANHKTDKRLIQYLKIGTTAWYKTGIACCNFINMVAIKSKDAGSWLCVLCDLSLKLLTSKVVKTVILTF